jgi:hypothetical protein
MNTSPLLSFVRSPSGNLLVLAATVACAFLLGRWSNAGARHTQGSSFPSSHGKSSGSRTGAEMLEQQVKVPVEMAGLELKNDAERLALHAITEAPGLRRINSFQVALEAIDDTNWNSVFEVMWKARRENLLNEAEFDLVMQRIGEVAGRQGLVRFKPADPVNEPETHSARFAMRGWAETDPAAAWAFIQEQPEGKFREGMITGYVWAAGVTDPVAAMKALDVLPSGSQAQVLRNTLRGREGAHYAALAEQWLEAKPAGEDPAMEQAQRQVFSSLLGVQQQQRWTDATGERMARWMERFAGRSYIAPEHVTIAAFTQGQENPERALAWAAEFTAANPQLGGSAASELMQRYGRRDVAAAAQWLDANRDSPLYPAALGGFLRSQRDQLDPETTQTWLATVEDEQARTRLAENLTRRGNGRGRGNRGR